MLWCLPGARNALRRSPEEAPLKKCRKEASLVPGGPSLGAIPDSSDGSSPPAHHAHVGLWNERLPRGGTVTEKTCSD
eukprot:1563449-Pyramimonas_sp.AAC.1